MSWGCTYTHYVCPKCDGYVHSSKVDVFHGPVIEERAAYSDRECGHCHYPSPIPNIYLMNQMKEKRFRQEREAREAERD